jgi:integrase
MGNPEIFGGKRSASYIANMKVKLKGINRVRKRLAGGAIVTYYYAWKGGPPLTGEKDSPEFIASYMEAIKSRCGLPTKDVSGLIKIYTSSDYFDGLKDSSKYTILGRFRRINEKFGELPLSAFGNPKIIDVLEAWRAKIAEHSTSNADGQWSSLSAMLTWAARRGHVKTNPCAGGGHVYNGSRVDKIWSEQQVARFVAMAPSHFIDAHTVALWTGQREGDLVKLKWSAYDGFYLTVTQEKHPRGQPPRTVTIPVKGQFKEFLDDLKRRTGASDLSTEEQDKRHILLTAYGQPWASAASFSNAFGRVSHDVVGIVDRTFHDLRGTAVTRLARAECTIPQIATITGHSLKTVEIILDRHYLHRDRVLADQAMDKRIAYENSQLNSQLADAAQ